MIRVYRCGLAFGVAIGTVFTYAIGPHIVPVAIVFLIALAIGVALIPTNKGPRE